MTRRVIANIVLTLDGRINGPGGPYDMRFIAPHGAGTQGRDALTRMTAATTAVLGRTNYDGFQGYWPTVADDPSADPRDREFSRWLDRVEKVVFTHSPETLTWANSTPATAIGPEPGTPAEVVHRLRDRGDGDIRVLSSASIIRDLLAADEIDVLELTIAPVIAGAGEPLFTGPLPGSEWTLAGPPTLTDTGALQTVYTRDRRPDAGMTTPAHRHARVAATFQQVVDATTDWAAPTPVAEWTAVDIVDHLLGWLPPVLASWAGITLPEPEGDGPGQRWAARTRAIQAIVDDEVTAGRPVQDGPFAGSPVGEVIDRIYSADVYMHTWDLARAAHVPVDLDPGYARELLDGMRPISAMLRESGQYGPEQPTDSPDPVVQLMAFVGRRP